MNNANRNTGAQITLRLSQDERDRIHKIGDAVRVSQPLATDSDVIRELIGVTQYGWITEEMRAWLLPARQPKPTHKVKG